MARCTLVKLLLLCSSPFASAFIPHTACSHHQQPHRSQQRVVCRQAVDASESPASVVARYKKLQNQSDVRGVSIDGVPGEKVTLGPLEAYCIGAAFAKWVHQRKESGAAGGANAGLTISVGRDCRLSGPEIGSALMGGMASQGLANVVDVGLCTTPAMFKSCISTGHMYDAAVMITASHLPMNRNGLKFFTKEGGLDKKGIGEIVAMAADVCLAGASVHEPEPSRLTNVEFLPVYQEQLAKMIRDGVGFKGDAYWTPLAGFKLVINAGNGMGGFIQDLLQSLGADTTGSLYLEPDGTFPNHLANPELPEAMEPTRAAVLAQEADLGIVLDTDVDRAGVVDHDGTVINRNRLIAIMANIVLRDHPGTYIVTDSTTSNGLNRFIVQSGGQHLRYKKGYKNVIDKAQDLNAAGVDCQLAIETSGHGALKENHMLDDGAYMAMKILVELARQGRGKNLSDLMEGLQEPLDEVEFRLRVPAGFETATVYQEALDAFTAAAAKVPAWEVEVPNFEGLRVNVDEGGGRRGWAMARMSLHDPIVIFNVESEVEYGVAAIAKQLLSEVLAGFEDRLDLSPLHKRIAAVAALEKEPAKVAAAAA